MLLLFAALLAPLFVDWTGFRQQFEDQASRIIGKKVIVHGSVDARLLPFPSITMNDVRVGQEPDGSPQIRVSRFSMDAELAPVLSGEALIFDMRIEDMSARIRLLKDGTLDWMRGSRPEIPARSIVLENVRIANGNITFIDEQSGRTREVKGLNAAMSAKSLAGPWKAVGDATLDGEPGRFSISTSLDDGKSGGLYMRARVTPNNRPVGAEMEGELALVDGKPSYKGTFLAFLQQKDEPQKAEADKTPAPRLKGSFELTNEKVRIPDYRLEVGSEADPYVVTGEATLDTGKDQEFLLLADGQQIDVARIDYNGSAGKTGRDPGDTVRKRFEHFVDIAASIPIPSVPGRASLKLPAILIGDTAIRDVRVDVRPTTGGWVVDNAIATLPGRTNLEAKGVLGLKGSPGFNGHLLLASRQPSGLSTWLTGQVDPVIRDLKALGFEADVRLTPELQRFDRLELQVGDSTLKGKVERQSIDAQTPALTAQLSGNRIDLEALRGLSTLFGKDGKADLSGHAIAAELKADRFAAFGMEAGPTETVFSFAKNALALERFSTKDLAGAQVTAIGRADFGKDGLDANGRISFKADDPTAFLTMIAQKLPADPLLGHLVRHAGWFAKTELKVTMAAGGKDQTGLSVKLAGTSNGSRVDMDLGLNDPSAYPAGAGLNLQATLENAKANVLLGQAGLDPLPFDVAEKGVLSLKLAEPKEGDSDLQVGFNAGKTAFDLKGKANLRNADGVTGSFTTTLESDDATPYLIMTGVTLPEMALALPGKLSAGLTLTPELIQLTDINGSIAGNSVSGHFDMDRKSEALKGTGALALAQADLTWLAETVYGQIMDAEGGFSRVPLGNSILADSNIALDLTAQTFWPDFTGPVRAFKTRLTASGGELLLDGISGEWGGGQLGGSIRLGNANGSGFVQTNLQASEGNLSAISWFVDGAPLLDGHFGLKVSGEGAGKSVRDIVAGFGGSGEIRLTDATARGLNLDILNPLITTMDVTEGEINTAKVNPTVDTLIGQGTTPLGDVTVPFSLSGGKVDVQPVSIATPLATITGDGEVDLSTGEMRASVNLGLVPGANAVDGADPTLRLDFIGPVAQPTRAVDTLGLTNFLSLRAFERERHRVDRLQAIAQEKLRLRREAGFYAARAAERVEQKRLDEERKRAEAEAAEKAKIEAEKARVEAERVKAEADAAAQKAAAEKAAADKLAAEQAVVAAEKAAAEKANAEKIAAARAAVAATKAKVEAARAKAEAERNQRSRSNNGFVPERLLPVNPDQQVIRGNDLAPPPAP